MVQNIIMGTKVPAKLWLQDVETNCMQQIVNLASLPFVFKHIAIMPDAHTGKGMPIGGVMATKGVIVPNAVGADIGCGMCAIKTNLNYKDLSHNDLTTMMSYIRETVPLGFNHQKTAVDESLMPEKDLEDLPVLKTKKNNILKEIGTLGGGNHFIEIQRDTATGDVWAMIHSGSRHIGLTVAQQYNEMAEFWCSKYYAETFPGLAFLPMETPEAKNYFKEMKFCVRLAFANRSEMMRRVQEAFAKVAPNVEFDPLINIAHNYAAWEQHFGENVIVHRKGATKAFKGEIGIIPGSMGTKSYIVEGLGNPQSFMSCSHGAGRRLSRSAAFQTLSLEEECREMDKQGIIHGMRKSGLDEAPGAYKDIAQVLAFEKDLVKPIVELAPLAVIKGD